MPKIVPSDIYPAVRRFLLESGLQRTLRALDKETSTGEEEAAASIALSKKAKALADLELIEACQCWLDARKQVNGAAAPAAAEEQPPEPGRQPCSPRPPKRKRQQAAAPAEEQEAEAGAKEEEAAVAEALTADSTEGNSTQEAGERPKKKKKEKEERPSGVPFKRIDDEKWISKIADARLRDNTHKAKQKFGTSAGDTWADKAAEDLGKVKGKGFRKEMAKKKRSSWRGGGEIDQGVNSIKFQDSSEEE